MFFVLSTGRAGSRTMASVLSQSPSCECLHEPEPRLIAETVQFRYGAISLERMTKLVSGRGTTQIPDRVYGEANNRLSLVVPALRAAYPEARFVWLVRDGRDFVASADQRGWYHPPEDGKQRNEWEATRLRGDLAGAVSSERWEAWSPFERICWSWTYVNGLIRDELLASGAEPYLLRLEELASAVDDLADFLGIERAPWAIGRHNARIDTAADPAERSERANRVEAISTWHSWSAERRARFEEHCGELMDEVYPGWRDGDGTWPSARVAEGAAPDLDQVQRDALLVASRADVAELGVAIRELRIQTRMQHRAVRRMEAGLKAGLEEARRLERENAALRKRLARYEARLWRRVARALRRRLGKPQQPPADAVSETAAGGDVPAGS